MKNKVIDMMMAVMVMVEMKDILSRWTCETLLRREGIAVTQEHEERALQPYHTSRGYTATLVDTWEEEHSSEDSGGKYIDLWLYFSQ